MSWPPWLEPLPDAALMRSTDQWAIQRRGMPSLELMERAGIGLARVVQAQAPDGRIVVVIGKGNNGGDGLVAARLLRERGRQVDVMHVWPLEEVKGDAEHNLKRLPGKPPTKFSVTGLNAATLIVDAVLGSGQAGAPRNPAKTVIEVMNAAAAPIVAADVPSGVNASTGAVGGVAVRALRTVSFHRGKPGLWILPGKQFAGHVDVVDIGIPEGAPGTPTVGLITPAVLDHVPHRDSLSTKYSSGLVFVLGGSRGLTGAPLLAAMGAMRAGAGYVSLGVPASLQHAYEARVLEATTAGLPDEGGHLVQDALDEVMDASARADAVVLGPGLGRREETQALVRWLVAKLQAPVVLDADGLNAHASRPEWISSRSKPIVMTPHAGELGRLLDVDSNVIREARLEHVRMAAEATQGIVVLKGDDTLIAEPSGRVAVSPGGAPGLATAGTGDVLAGVIAAMLAKDMNPFQAACTGVYAHVRAGRMAAGAHGPDGVVAGDVAAHLRAAFAPAPREPVA